MRYFADGGIVTEENHYRIGVLKKVKLQFTSKASKVHPCEFIVLLAEDVFEARNAKSSIRKVMEEIAWEF